MLDPSEDQQKVGSMFQALISNMADVTEGSGSAGDELGDVDSNFAAQIATAVWLGYLTETAAREALLSYAIACQLCGRSRLIRLREALMAEYRLCRERQELVS